LEDRTVPGHWEGDLLFSGRNSHVATLVERRSRFLMFVRVGGMITESVLAALMRQAQQLPQATLNAIRKPWPLLRHLIADAGSDRTKLMHKSAFRHLARRDRPPTKRWASRLSHDDGSWSGLSLDDPLATPPPRLSEAP